MRTACCVLAILISLPSLAQRATPAQVPASAFTIRVIDPNGAVIGNAFVLLHADSLERENPKPFTMELRTNSNGEARAELPSGFYNVFIASTGFAPQCKEIRMRDGKPVTVKVVLKINKLISREYADQFNQ